MTIIYKKGDFLAGPEKVAVHQCNMQGVMGSGCAKQVREQFPEAYRVYQMAAKAGQLRLGNIMWVDCVSKVIVNLIGQNFYGRDKSVRYGSYDALDDGLKKINEEAKKLGITEIAFPQIGAGTANGNWNVIVAIIESRAIDFQPIVYIYEE